MIGAWAERVKEKRSKVKIEILNFYESRVYINPFTSDATYEYLRNIDIIRLYRRAVRASSDMTELSMEVRCPKTKQIKPFLLKGHDMLQHFVKAVRKTHMDRLAISAGPRTSSDVTLLRRVTPQYTMWVSLDAIIDGEPAIVMMVHHENKRLGTHFYTALMEEDIKLIRNREYRMFMDYCYNHPIVQMMAELGCDWCYDK